MGAGDAFSNATIEGPETILARNWGLKALSIMNLATYLEGLFFGAFFFWRLFFLAPFCFSSGKKERKKRGDAYVERAGPQALKGVLGCNTLKP